MNGKNTPENQGSWKWTGTVELNLLQSLPPTNERLNFSLIRLDGDYKLFILT